ncbi:MAG: hypothetical protein KatS3mg103_0692 [Phycisphaerales bacterium]|nr:MAG: hypothetical protein KatS3mg103_0692 [Phycisphaerales bacterium]
MASFSRPISIRTRTPTAASDGLVGQRASARLERLPGTLEVALHLVDLGPAGDGGGKVRVQRQRLRIVRQGVAQTPGVHVGLGQLHLPQG